VARLPRATPTALFLAACVSAACDLGRGVEEGDPSPAHASHETTPPSLASEGVQQPLRIPQPPPTARSSFNKFSSSPDRAAQRLASRRSTPTLARATQDEILPGSLACERARREVGRMEAYIASIEQEIEWLEDQADDIKDTPRSRGYYEGRLEAAEQQLEQAQDALSDHLDVQREQGVPPGCLR
jgi:hypothetical protein